MNNRHLSFAQVLWVHWAALLIWAGMADFTWGKKWKQWQLLFPWAPESLRTANEAAKLKDACFLEEKLLQTQTAYYKAETSLQHPGGFIYVPTLLMCLFIYPLSENESVSCSVISNSLRLHVL